MAVTVLGQQGFNNGFRLVQWRGYRSILDAKDTTDPKGRTVGQLKRMGFYGDRMARRLDAVANRTSRYTLVPGVTGRQLVKEDGMSREYRFERENGYRCQMDAIDVERLFRHPVIGPEFFLADEGRVATIGAAPSLQARAQWEAEMKRKTEREELADFRRFLGGR